MFTSNKVLPIKYAILIGVSLSLLSISSQAQDYYVNNEGNDSNDGLTEQSAFKTLAKVNAQSLTAGDNIYLASGQEFVGTVKIANEAGTSELPISITTYGDNSKRAIIDAKNELAGIDIVNASYLNISNIEIHANGGTAKKYRTGAKMRLGVLVDVNDSSGKEYGHITFDNLFIHDIYHENVGFDGRGDDVNTNNGTQAYGWGVRLYNNNNNNTVLTNITFQNSEISDVAHTGFKTTSNSHRDLSQRRWGGIYKVNLNNNYLHDIGGPGIMFGGANDSYVGHNRVHRTGSGSDTRKWSRGSGMWPWGSRDLLIEHNEFTDAQGPADSAGFHIDFNCTNVVIQYNLSKNNAGGFIEILGNNENNSYRYNVSVNDGYRQKGINGASHDGKIFWLSGYVGKNNSQIAPKNNYIYNNTVYVKEDQLAQFAVHNETDGLVVANNMFIIAGASRHIDQDKYHLVDGVNPTQDIVVKNNLFLNASNWPSTLLAKSTEAVIGNPLFANQGGFEIIDYIPTNNALIANQGIEIVTIADDPIGLVPGLVLSKDILGHSINGNEHIGAISPFDESTKPSAILSAIVLDKTFQQSLIITVDFNTKISGLSLDDFTLVNGVIINLIKISDTQWSFSLMPDQYGLTTVKLNADTVVDANDIGNLASEYSITFEQVTDESDTKSPIAIISGPPGSVTTQADFTLTFDFDETVIDFQQDDLITENSTLTSFTKINEKQWKVGVKSSAYGIVSIILPDSVVFDVVANGNEQASYSINYNDSPKQTSSEESEKSGGSIWFLGLFSLIIIWRKQN